jgi:serine/threonine protein kinase
MKRNDSYSTFSSRVFPEFKTDEESFFPAVNILEDAVLKTVSEKEYELTKLFSDQVLNGTLLNFPMVYSVGMGKPNGTKVVMAMEKFDEDLTSVMERDTLPLEEYISMIIQVILALYTLDALGKYHGDLNPGNVMYKTITTEDEVDSEHPGYLQYTINGETICVKHFNKLWVLLDFEYTGDKGEVLPEKVFNEDYLKRVFGELYYDQVEKPVRGSWLYDMLALTRFISASLVNERVFGLMRGNSPLNPFEAIPHLIKSDVLSEVLVKNCVK